MAGCAPHRSLLEAQHQQHLSDGGRPVSIGRRAAARGRAPARCCPAASRQPEDAGKQPLEAGRGLLLALQHASRHAIRDARGLDKTSLLTAACMPSLPQTADLQHYNLMKWKVDRVRSFAAARAPVAVGLCHAPAALVQPTKARAQQILLRWMTAFWQVLWGRQRPTAGGFLSILWAMMSGRAGRC